MTLASSPAHHVSPRAPLARTRLIRAEIMKIRTTNTWLLLLAGVGVGICSSVVPYVTDQLAMARLPRATFALMMGIMPAVAAAIGAIVLGQIPTAWDIGGVGLVVAGVVLHQPGPPPRPASGSDL